MCHLFKWRKSFTYLKAVFFAWKLAKILNLTIVASNFLSLCGGCYFHKSKNILSIKNVREITFGGDSSVSVLSFSPIRRLWFEALNTVHIHIMLMLTTNVEGIEFKSQIIQECLAIVCYFASTSSQSFSISHF